MLITFVYAWCADEARQRGAGPSVSDRKAGRRSCGLFFYRKHPRITFSLQKAHDRIRWKAERRACGLVFVGNTLELFFLQKKPLTEYKSWKNPFKRNYISITLGPTHPETVQKDINIQNQVPIQTRDLTIIKLSC